MCIQEWNSRTCGVAAFLFLLAATFIACERSPAPSSVAAAPERAALPETTSSSESVSTAGLPDASARQRAMEARAEVLRRQLGSEFHIRYEWPFVAAGNLPANDFDMVFENSLMGSYKCLHRDYFTSEPDHLISVYLFKDDSDYRRYALELFGDRPDTPFGYYSHVHRALIMNIGTGTGTLVHEICHALVGRDFPNCPTWFNEGLASLHEQCAWRDGSLVGLPNWRLPKLQEAIRSGEALSLKDLMAKADPTSFYRQDKGLNYATARYLCQYLQQRGKLKDFYALLRRNVRDDPTGEKTLVHVLGSSRENIEADWQRWIMTLRFQG